MKKILTVILLLPLLNFAQGVRFSEIDSWTKVLEQAKRENKFILVDCFASWCAPCKLMDQTTFTDPSVGSFLNKSFISVKVQMDQTKTDSEHYKSWRKDASELAINYQISAYPTYLFFSPDGRQVGKETGYLESDRFISAVKKVMEPNRKYVDKYAEYANMIADFRSGVKINYKRMPYLIQSALERYETKLYDSLVRSYGAYLKTLPKSDLLHKDILNYFARNVELKRTSYFFDLFYPNGFKVDSVMGRSGYANWVVDKAIRTEFIAPSIKLAGKISEPAWDSLYNQIKEHFPEPYVQRAISAGKVNWLGIKIDPKNSLSKINYRNAYMDLVNNYGIESVLIYNPMYVGSMDYWFLPERQLTKLSISGFCDLLFIKEPKVETITKYQFDFALKWAKYAISLVDKEDFFQSFDVHQDYALLLYKSGNKSEAIKCQQTAIQITRHPSIAPQFKQEAEDFLSKMLNNSLFSKSK